MTIQIHIHDFACGQSVAETKQCSSRDCVVQRTQIKLLDCAHRVMFCTTIRRADILTSESGVLPDAGPLCLIYLF